jgi:hypothetical protein
MKLRYLFLLAILAIVAFFGILSISVPGFETKAFPILIIGAILILGIIELYRDLRARESDEEEQKARIRTESQLSTSRILSTAGWIVSFPLAVWLLGFVSVIPLVTASYLRSSKVGWSLSVILAVLTTVFFVVVFEFALRAELYRGQLFFLIEKALS